jgi:lipopolysaccharide/colanic/teichoic acid biosynthesis glycosyltransferase
MKNLEAESWELDYSDVAWENGLVIGRNGPTNSCELFTATHIDSWRYALVKRAVDVVGSLMMILAFMIPGLMIAAAIALTSKGPIFYRETRVGRGARPFRIWKFRSMRSIIEWPEAVETQASCGDFLAMRVRKNHRDPRITPIGGFLRRWSLDELPQALNVLCGEMSLVGPRPVVEAEVLLYGHLSHYYLAVVPGLSGIWQVSGRSNLNFRMRADLDAHYVRNWSLQTDLGIMLRTIPAVLSRVGAR